MHSPDMLAFTYKIQKVARDMKGVALPDEDAALKRDAILESLREICRTIDSTFSDEIPN